MSRAPAASTSRLHTASASRAGINHATIKGFSIYRCADFIFDKRLMRQPAPRSFDKERGAFICSLLIARNPFCQLIDIVSHGLANESVTF